MDLYTIKDSIRHQRYPGPWLKRYKHFLLPKLRCKVLAWDSNIHIVQESQFGNYHLYIHYVKLTDGKSYDAYINVDDKKSTLLWAIKSAPELIESTFPPENEKRPIIYPHQLMVYDHSRVYGTLRFLQGTTVFLGLVADTIYQADLYDLKWLQTTFNYYCRNDYGTLTLPQLKPGRFSFS
ncbi:hypothetical protein SAMN05428988_3182 [Chitinophaga sp. YR573]|uniref:hypothetical protein n=1 Tax=Chitinophaga sp. YR573 TaxID=1881040 RepID=UPI0008BA6553|nr:hypothetical protein [Chitinophaga sp. YR573]SEW21184.1 hypothetical protein SAMN05428988_3182 [Chitinophaga sp. YR573]